jgi:universal stress protein A
LPRIQAILVPTDFSPAARSALDYGVRLAERLGATVHVLHVVEGLSITSGEGTYAALPEGFFEHLEQTIRARLAVHLCQVVAGTVPAIRATRMGNPAREIACYARDRRIDLIVLPRSGRGRAAQLLLGSVADKIARMAPCPVVMMPPAADHDAGAENRAA